MLDFVAEGIDLAHAVGGGVEVKTTCPQCSHTRKKKTDRCLNVNTETGVFHCWHCDWSGKAKGGEVEAPRAMRREPKAWVRPKVPPPALTIEALFWFSERGITKDVLHRNRVTSTKIFMPQVESEVSCIAFPYLRGGEVINCKYRDGRKNFRMATGAERLLYGHDDLDGVTVIVEGEIDKLSVEVAGFPNCVSVPDGAPAPGSKNLSAKFDYLNDEALAKVERWIIAVDNDPPGLCLKDELVRRFGPERCVIVAWPDGCKDANDVLVQFGPQRLRKCIEEAKEEPIAGVFHAADFVDDYLRMYDEGVPNGISTGWSAVDANWRVQLGQLLVVTGIPGHGKSEWVDALCVNLARSEGWRTGVYSPENQPERLHLMKLAEKYTGKPFNQGVSERMSRAEASDAADWINSQFFWIKPEQPSLDEVMDKARALVARNGINILVIDPWNEVEHARPQGLTEAEYVGQSLMRIRRFARKHQVLAIVVAHPRLMERKSDGTYPPPDPYAISGGAMWRNKADNCIAVYSPNLEEPIVQIHVQKVKFKLYGRVGMAELSWDRVTGRYENAGPKEVQFDEYPEMSRKKR